MIDHGARDRLKSAAASVARVEKPSDPAFIHAEPGGASFPFGLVRAPWLKTQFLGLGRADVSES